MPSIWSDKTEFQVRTGDDCAPFGRRNRASLFVIRAGDEMTFLVEMVVNLSTN